MRELWACANIIVTMSTLEIVLIIVGALIVVAGLTCLLYFTVIRNAKTAKLVRETVKKYESSHSLLFGDVSKYVKRLEHIASMNLSYAEEASSFNRRYNDLVNMSDQTALNASDQLEGLLDDKHYKDIRDEFPSHEAVIKEYVERVENLYTSLKEKFQEEEDTGSIVVDLGGKYRALRQTYNNHQNELAILSQSFETVFGNIDNCLVEVNHNIDNANYARANRILSTMVEPAVSELTRLIVNLPGMCVSAQSILPDRLSSLKYRYDEMLSLGYPLNDIITPETFLSLENKIKAIVNKLKKFEVDGLQDEIDLMVTAFDGYSAAFDKEEEAHKIFDEEHDTIYKNEQAMEGRWVNLCHAIPDIRRVFAFSDEDLAMVDIIHEKIDLSSATKRSLDTFEHSSNRQAYTVLVEKMHELRDQTDDCIAHINEFHKSLVRMKKDVESANADLPTYAIKVRQAEASIRDINIPSVEAKYSQSINSIFEMIDNLYETISSVPIDVRKVNSIHEELKSTAVAFFTLLEKEKIDLEHSEDCIKYRNRFRSSSDNNSLLRQAEGLFSEGEFAAALELASKAEDPLQNQANNL